MRTNVIDNYILKKMQLLILFFEPLNCLMNRMQYISKFSEKLLDN